MYKAYI